MKTIRWPTLHAALCASIFSITAGCAKEQAVTRVTPATAGQAAEVPVETPAAARSLLLRMADFLVKTPRFSVEIRSGYDVVQESGQKIEFGEARKVLVSRPDRLRVEAERSDGDRNLVLFDGRTITLFGTPQNIYAQAENPAASTTQSLTFSGISACDCRSP